MTYRLPASGGLAVRQYEYLSSLQLCPERARSGASYVINQPRPEIRLRSLQVRSVLTFAVVSWQQSSLLCIATLCSAYKRNLDS